MSASNFDVVIVGGGCAGMTAAIGLARSGFAVAVVEAAAFPGAENWSGCVYFCENLAHPDILGPDGVEALAWERRLVERGFFATDGHGLLGMTYRDPQAFRNCYTVLRPIFDHHLAQIAVKLGVALLNETTAESLIRDGGRVVGVCTQRGALYADLVFLAEGDASHLVTREGYERYPDEREAPKFLQGIKQIIDVPPGVIEETFHLGPEEGAAYEMMIRNGSLRGRSVRLNMGGFVYTNRQSLSIGLVLPADNLRDHFGGDPNLLIEWFEQLPALSPWLKQGSRGVFGAKIIRGGGARDIPRLVDDGLAIGGAASAIGIDFPYPNFTGPATRMGLLLVEAVRRIRASKGGFTQANLEQHYLKPLQQTHYWQDVEFLRRWPGYVKRTTAFFGSHLDLSLGTAYLWSRPKRWLPTKWINWLRLIWHVTGPAHWEELRGDLRHLARALRLDEVVGRPGIWQLMLDGTLNALRDMVGSPRAQLAPAGELKLHYSVGGDAEATGLPPRSLRRWFQRFLPVLAAAARRVYANDEEPLAIKLKSSTALLVRQVNMLDVLAAGALGLFAGLFAAFLAGWSYCWSLVTRRSGPILSKLIQRYEQRVRQTTDLTGTVAAAGQHWESRLGQLAYQSVKESHIHLMWPKSLPDKNAVVQQGLWHVCPAHVYEARLNPLGQLQVVVNFENCIKCETCWRTSDLVDWGRDGQHRFIYPVHSAAVARLVQAAQLTGPGRPLTPRCLDWWKPLADELAEKLRADRPTQANGHYTAEIAELADLLYRLERKLEEFDEALAEEPRTIDRARADYLEKLARYAHQLATRFAEVIATGMLADSPRPGIARAHQELQELANALVKRTEQRARRTWQQRYGWAAADGRQIRFHHLVGLRRLLQLLGGEHRSDAYGSGRPLPALTGPGLPSVRWLQAEDDAAEVALQRRAWMARLDAVFPAQAWRDLDRGQHLSSAQDALLRDLLAHVPGIDASDLAQTLHPPLRKALLAELGRRDPSLAYRAATHLWARDLARLAGTGAPFLARANKRWARGEEWACFAAIAAVQTSSAGWQGEALFVPTAAAQSLLLMLGDQLTVVPVAADQRPAGLTVESLPTLGLRGAGMARLRLDNLTLPEERFRVDQARIRRAWSIISAADLTAIASGMADLLCERATAHAASRVQFPGLFHDEESRDTIGKFGAVKKMLAEMATRRWLLQTLDHVLSPVDFSTPSVEQAGLVKLLAAEALGTAPGSLAYNAGQILGGTGFSEDDIFAKFYRDAAAWRFVGVPNVEVLRHHGEELLHGWRADGQRLAALADEGELFDQLAQRKALQNELDQVRVYRSHLRGLVNEWLAARARSLTAAPLPPQSIREPRLTFSPRAAAEVAQNLARADAHLLANKALLLRLHARMERGLGSETALALTRVWLQESSLALEDFDSCIRLQFALAARRANQPLVEPEASPPPKTYAEYLASANPYNSGNFLDRPVDLVRPRFLPEMIDADPALADRNKDIRAKIADFFGQPRVNGLPYERHVERQHRPDDADLDFCRRNGFFRMTIPRQLGGEERPKVDYYLLTTACQQLADVAVSLTIQVNTSLGTTPVMLARDKDLPRAEKELKQFIAEPALAAAIGVRLNTLGAMIGSRESQQDVEKTYNELHAYLEKSVFGSAALRAMAHRFLEAWQQAGMAGKDFDLTGVRRHLEQAGERWREDCSKAPEYLTELGRRREACDLFLRWIASGQISAFALTEPSAGSDTARVATRAVLRTVPVEKDSKGIWRFVPAGAREPRVLLDSRLIEFRAEASDRARDYRAHYRWSPAAEPVPIHFDGYDYETDDPEGVRYYEHDGHRTYFTDIAQVRERDGQFFYDYWELNGAKMWITNGRMAGVMCLYAKTEEGITGFLVDRHAEGLIVGKDEDKLGQCGSPTNELSLQTVRVPRENVIGIEGRGQVNALETLNVGRAGLAMSAMAQMAGLIEQSRVFAQATYGEIPDWVEWRLGRMEEERFTSEALAHEVIGRFEHPQTKSVRLESAIAKALVSEALHRVIELAEDIHGMAGQTQLHLIEKRKRDARVLTIYEGTNEIQRFFILKDLAASGEDGGQASVETKSQTASPEVQELESLRQAVRQRVKAAIDVFGQDLWQNPKLQANCFLLSEAVAWLKAADSTLARYSWCERMAASRPAAQHQLAASSAPRALQRCTFEVRHRLRRFDEELSHLRRGFYAEEIRAADLLFLQPAAIQPAFRMADRITRPLSILVVLEPTAATLPHPHVEDGKIVEAYWSLTAADQAALETALQLRDQALVRVGVQVVAVGPRPAALALRETLSLGIDRARLLVTEASGVTSDSAALALAAILRSAGPFDLVLGGAGTPDQEEGLLARLTAEALGIPHAGNAAQLTVRSSEAGGDVVLQADGSERLRDLPLGVSVEPEIRLRSFGTEGYLSAVSKAVELERWPKRIPARGVSFAAGMPRTQIIDQEGGSALSPPAAASRLLQEIGLRRDRPAPTARYAGEIEEIQSPTRLSGRVVVVLATDKEGQLESDSPLVVQAARLLADINGAAMTVLMVVSSSEEAQRRALAQLRSLFTGDVVLWVGENAIGQPELRRRLLEESWPAGMEQPSAVIGAPWTEPAFAALAVNPALQQKATEDRQPANRIISRVRTLSREGDQVGIETMRAQGKLRAKQTMAVLPGVAWLTLAPDAEVDSPMERHDAGSEGKVERWAPRLERFFASEAIQRLLDEVKTEVGVGRLADAEFIIDVGFGVGNRDGYEAVIEPLEQALRELGVANVMIGGSRKVTEELHLLSADRQIGQSGVSVNPRILLAIGISGAPQHLSYIGPRATILAFNRDPEAPLLTLNRRQPRPRVFPIVGDLFETVPALIAALRLESSRQDEPAKIDPERQIART
jgi:electron transfer flavoprotein-quinone oxidoreductase